MIQRDYRLHEELLLYWTVEAEELLHLGERDERLFDLLFWAKAEFHRRRVYLGKEEPELKRRAAKTLRTLGCTETREGRDFRANAVKRNEAAHPP